MQPEVFGIVVIFAGIVALGLDYRWTIVLAIVFTLLAAAEAVGVPALGGATITPPHLFSGFVILKALLQRNGTAQAAESLAIGRPGGWLVLAILYGVFLSVASPGMFPYAPVYAFGRQENGASVRLEPLTFGSGQITQDVYAIGSVLIFASTVALLRKPDASRHMLTGFAACAILNLLFAAVDVGSYYAGNADLLGFVRSGGYAQLYSNVEGGVKRIVGSFPESSSFATYSCLLLGFWTSLWMQRYRPLLSGTLALGTLIAMLLSTSSTAYVAIAVLFSLFAASQILTAALKRGTAKRLTFMAVAVPLMLFVALALALVKPEIIDALTTMIDDTILNKANTASGMERFTWNSQAWQNFVDTNGVGVGIGGARASSYPLILLSNIGFLGTLAFSIFAYKVLSVGKFHPANGDDLAIGLACRWAFAGSLIANAVSAGVFELGVLPYLAAAGAAAIGFRDFKAARHSSVRLSNRLSNEQRP
jgi:hypothetical protein